MTKSSTAEGEEGEPERVPLPHESRLLKWHEMQELQFELPECCKKKTLRKNPGKTIRENKHMQQQAMGLSRMQRKASKSLKRSEVTRTTLPMKSSPWMHRQNIEDKATKEFTRDNRIYKGTKEFTQKRKYLASRKAYEAWNKKIEMSWENKETKMKAMSKIYGPGSLWGRMEEKDRLRMEALNARSETSVGANLSPLQLSKAMYDANRIATMVKTNVQTALLHEDNVKKVAGLLEKARAATVLQKAIRAFQKRSWERKFVKIDPLLKTLVLEEREVEKHIVNEAAKKHRFVIGGQEPDISHSPVDFDDRDQTLLGTNSRPFEVKSDHFCSENDGFGASDREFHEQMRQKVENDMAGADDHGHRIRHFASDRFEAEYEANSPSYHRPRPRTATAMSDLTRSSGSPTRGRSASNVSSAGDLATSPNRSRYNSEFSAHNTAGGNGVHGSTWGSGGVTGMDVNLVNAKERAMRNSAATDVAIQEAKELQMREKRRRSTVLQGISEQVRLVPNPSPEAGKGRISPTIGLGGDGKEVKRRSSVMKSPVRPMSAIGGKKKQRPSTAGVGSRRPSSASLMSGSGGGSGRNLLRVSSKDPSISQIKHAQNARKMGPRTMARRQEKIIDHHAGGAISLLRKRNTVVRKHIKKGREGTLGHQNTAKNLVAKALHGKTLQEEES
ncbi:hypothetical protein TL16_g03106 [Triparma laevis f. inornata]|uniref:Uncharacterized protein n=1 Tax=Triparma laevis f. inornata TaxID=1714386 RepID=A0A9W7A2A4_9STRA|nr:hypothetical protein TL16_g03106 [Triparma laevis f. inornata]